MWTTWVVALFSAPGDRALVDRAADVPGRPSLLRSRLGGSVASGAKGRPGGRCARERRGARRSARARQGPSGWRWGCSPTSSGRDGIDVLKLTGFAPYGGEFGYWLVGEQGALLVRDGILGKRVFSWCVRVGDAGRSTRRGPRGAPPPRPSRGRGGIRDDREPELLGCRMARAAASAGGAALGGQSEFAVALGLGDDGGVRLRIASSVRSSRRCPVGVEGVVGERERDFGVDDSRSRGAEDLAKLGLRPDGAEVPGRGAHDGGGLAGERRGGAGAGCPVDGVLQDAGDGRVVFRRGEDEAVRIRR